MALWPPLPSKDIQIFRAITFKRWAPVRGSISCLHTVSRRHRHKHEGTFLFLSVNQPECFLSAHKAGITGRYHPSGLHLSSLWSTVSNGNQNCDKSGKCRSWGTVSPTYAENLCSCLPHPKCRSKLTPHFRWTTARIVNFLFSGFRKLRLLTPLEQMAHITADYRIK